MFTPSSETTVIIPYHPIPNARAYITDNYFGDIPAERLQVKDSVLYFTCDGKLRSKIGLSPLIAKPIAASFDFQKNVLRKGNMPYTRLQMPIALSGNYFAADRLVVKGYLRFYIDDWGIISQTASLELPVKITPFFSVSPYYRYYRQTAAKF